MQQQLRHCAEAREQAGGDAARQTEVQQQHDAAEAALPPGVGAARCGAPAGRPWHILELPDHLSGADGSFRHGFFLMTRASASPAAAQLLPTRDEAYRRRLQHG